MNYIYIYQVSFCESIGSDLATNNVARHVPSSDGGMGKKNIYYDINRITEGLNHVHVEPHNKDFLAKVNVISLYNMVNIHVIT